MNRTAFLALGVWLLSVPSPAQTAAAAFEAASVKLNVSGGARTALDTSPGRVVITNMPLRELVQSAFGIQSFQLENVPDWASSQRFDVVAKAEGPVSVRQLQEMLQPLLADRFKLATRREVRDMDVLALTMASRDGRLGPTLKPATMDCENLIGSTNRFSLRPPSPTGEPSPCGITPAGPGRIVTAGISMTGLAALLSPSQRKLVIDRTGLTGRYDVTVVYTPEAFSAEALKRRPSSLPPGLVDPNGPSLITALQDQLGLKLESARAPVDVIVIDRLEPLTTN